MSKKSVSQKECKQLFLAVYNTKLIIEGVNGRLKKKNVNITQMLSNWEYIADWFNQESVGFFYTHFYT